MREMLINAMPDLASKFAIGQAFNAAPTQVFTQLSDFSPLLFVTVDKK